MVLTRRRRTREPPAIEIGDRAELGIVQMTAGLFAQASASRPGRARRLRGSLCFRGTDHRFATTVYFEGERIRVIGSADPDASVAIEGPMMTLAKLAGGGHALRGYFRREIKVRGALRHPLLLIRTRRLLGAAAKPGRSTAEPGGSAAEPRGSAAEP
jgi:hypothetical protein